MLGAQDPLSDLKRLVVQRLCLGVLALGPQGVRKVGEALQRIRMLGAEGLFFKRQHAAIELDSFCILTKLAQGVGQGGRSYVRVFVLPS